MKSLAGNKVTTKKVKIARSKIHGRGVFAARNIKRGDVVMNWDVSHRLTKRQAQLLPKKLQQYLNRDVQGRLILLQFPERFVNHSCQPNTRVRRAADVAIRNIYKGEEITSDYSSGQESKITIKCACGGKNCKKTINV